MLLHTSVHRAFDPFSLRNNTSDLNSDAPTNPSESPMIESDSQIILPALLGNGAPVLSGHNHDELHHFTTQAYLNSESSFTWPRSEQSVSFGHTAFDCRTESTSPSAIHSRNCLRNVEDQAKGEWSFALHQQLPTPFPSLASSFNNNAFEAEAGLNPPTQSSAANGCPFLPSSTHQSQLPPWTDYTAPNAFDETRTGPRCNPPQAFSYDSTPPFASSLYATSSDLRIPSHSKSQRPLLGTERSAPFDSESETEGKQGEPPYAKLIYQALMDAPEHQMVLKDIYEWIARNTDKARDPAFKGWQNSVRHNLSMNGAFRKVPHIDPLNKAKKGFIWVLEPSAVGAGIESTTRYRQKAVGKRIDNVEQADPKRQRSGRKGGRATRKSAKLRRSALLDHAARHAHYPKTELGMTFTTHLDEPLRQTSSPHQNWSGTKSLPYYLTPPSSSSQPSFPEDGIYDHGSMTETAQIPQNESVLDRQDGPLFGHSYDSGCELMQHDGSGTFKFEDQYLANRLTAFT